MLFQNIVSSLLLLASIPAAQASDPVTKLANHGIEIRKRYDDQLAAQGKQGCTSCTFENAAVRREWGSLSKKERKDYIDAVLCLQSKPSITPRDEWPGVRTRYDDFVATHINQSMSIHSYGLFLTWHRYFVWEYEQALHKECGYNGTQPYWDWGAFAHDPVKSPVFDGSDTSMSGDGEYVPHNGTVIGIYTVPSGKGGGCVKSGPFKDMVVNLGPISPGMAGIESNGTGKDYNPRCLKRDINPYLSKGWLKYSDITRLINKNDNHYWFVMKMMGSFMGTAPKDFNVHTAGHSVIGGDPGSDLFSSPGDPAFFLHHSQIDRTWWIWQNQKPKERLYDLEGTHTIFNNPPSKNVTLDESVDLGVNAKPRVIRTMMDTMSGPFCYYYQ
ncbi:tyrosinase [Ascosphaera apis ARSEF 7405]|uniref:Tyrosinase n=1 Tax=Ascosphaera apis ARSEF 7405 TaxID=392613 RepID=A0A162JG37_9EURO|nr:tyrosinase [Ascosphaera apis ARSEF 7405]